MCPSADRVPGNAASVGQDRSHGVTKVVTKVMQIHFLLQCEPVATLDNAQRTLQQAGAQRKYEGCREKTQP